MEREWEKLRIEAVEYVALEEQAVGVPGGGDVDEGRTVLKAKGTEVLLEELAALLVFEAVGGVDEIGLEAYDDERNAEVLSQDSGREGGRTGAARGDSSASQGR